MLQAENTLFTIAVIGYFVLTVLNFAFVALKKEKLSSAAFFLQTGLFILHTAALVLRGIGAGRWPMTNQYEFATSFAWALCLVSLIFIRKYRFPVLGAFSSPLILLMIGYASMQNREVRELMPSLRSSWLAFHVSTAIIAYGSFGVAFVLSLIFLFRDRMNEDGFWGQHIPQQEKLDIISYRSVCLGMLFLTLTILTGAIWAEQAWGSYLDYLRDLSSSAPAPRLEGESSSLVCSNWLYLRHLYLYRREYIPAGDSQLRIRGFIKHRTGGQSNGLSDL